MGFGFYCKGTRGHFITVGNMAFPPFAVRAGLRRVLSLLLHQDSCQRMRQDFNRVALTAPLNKTDPLINMSAMLPHT